ncbi:related to DNA repair exonuclease SIA1 [Rhynchosporium graminicola]|uniref:Related to DNA repair exonuclease SIA1 n=1 Tax=Rhynchosporium graminicola TaxID=2792576 RepID=A0A1E1LMQ0_9HELO|nr:related to DNA repair exonuclease SIA1 [Rhynchosporium commune]
MYLPDVVSRWLTATSLFTSRDSSKQSHQSLLRLNDQHEFRITIFADLHYGEEESGWGIDQDIKSTRVINAILDSEKSDFVVLNGDLITGEDTLLENSTKYLDVVVAPLVERKIRWASTYGNHDSKFNLSRSALFKEEDKYALSYTESSPSGVSGVTNYHIPIFAPEKDSDDTPLAILWIFDSQGGAPFQAESGSVVNWVDSSIVSWFTKERELLKKKYSRDIPSLAFVHIPPSAFLTVQNELLPNVGDESAHFPGLNDDVPLAVQGDGEQDVPFMQALVDTPGLHSVYSGHDHGDSWCANWPKGKGTVKGVSKPHLCFCKHSGYGGYGNWNRGARVVKLRFGGKGGKEMDVESWVRMENGSLIQRVGLNETYGVDVYPPDNGEIETNE